MDSFATEAAAAPDGEGGVIVVGMTTAAGVAFCETLTFIVCAARSVDSFAMEAAAPDGVGGVIAVDICTAADVCVEPEGVTTVGMQHTESATATQHAPQAVLQL